MTLGIRGQYYKYREFSLNLLAIYKQRTDLQAFLEIILSLSTLIIFIVFAIKPTALTMVSLNKEINSKTETLNILNKKISDLQTANNIYIQNLAVIPDIDSAIFTLPHPDTISKQILGLGIKNQVTITNISIDSANIFGQAGLHKDTGDLKPLPNNSIPLSTTINIKGEYTNLVSFLKDVEKLRIPVKIDSLTLNSSKSTSGTTLVEVINARVPYLGK